jgi:hypothetical protein
MDETGFATGIAELSMDLEAAVRHGTLPPELPMQYVVPAVAAMAFEIAAAMAANEPTDVEGATAFCAELWLGGLERLHRMSSAGTADPARPDHDVADAMSNK